MLQRYKGIICAAMAALLLSAGSATAAEQDTRRAYDAARRCMVANSFASIRFKKAGDAANAQRFATKGETAFKLSYQFGDMLHLSQAQVKRDLDATSEIEMAKLVQDSGYLTTVAGFCKQWDLM